MHFTCFCTVFYVLYILSRLWVYQPTSVHNCSRCSQSCSFPATKSGRLNFDPQGDSGGPLMCKLRTQTTFAWFVFGMVSHGNECAKPNEPGFYVNVQHYIVWINETIHSFSWVSYDVHWAICICFRFHLSKVCTKHMTCVLSHNQNIFFFNIEVSLNTYIWIMSHILLQM